MRLAFVSHSLPPADNPLSNTGGMQRVAEELLTELQSRTDVTLYPIVLRGSWRWIHFRTGPFLIKSFFRLRRLARTQQIDAVVFSSMVTATLTILLQRLFFRNRVASLAIVHGLDITTDGGIYQKIVRRVFRSIDMILPVSAATAQACMERGLPRDRVHVVHNGVDIHRFEPVTDRSAARRELVSAYPNLEDLITHDTFLLCSVGRLVKRKGFAWFIEQVMPGLPENVHYWIAGDGPEAETIRRAIEKNHLAHRVQTLGKVDEKQLLALYRAADLFLMPNVHVPGDMEGFGIVMLEAGMNGLPTVGARIEGIREVISEGENGTFVESGDAEGFAGAILAYERDRDDLESASLRSRAYTESTFGWETVADRYLSVCTEVRFGLGPSGT